MPLRSTKSASPGLADNSWPNFAGLSSWPGKTGLGNAMHCMMISPRAAGLVPVSDLATQPRQRSERTTPTRQTAR
jgi:hypothetical protein